MPTTYLSVSEAAQRLGVVPLTIRREISRGNLKAYRFGRRILIDPRDIDKALTPITNAAALRGGEAIA